MDTTAPAVTPETWLARRMKPAVPAVLSRCSATQVRSMTGRRAVAFTAARRAVCGGRNPR